jgi:response regulator of citrate/malate metabolism
MSATAWAEAAMGGVLLIDNDEDLLEALSDWVKVISGKPCLALRGLAELMRVGPRALEHDLALVDINLDPGAPTGMDVCAWLRGHRFRGRIVFLTGHGQGDPIVQRACRLGRAEVLRKPIEINRLAELINAEAA